MIKQEENEAKIELYKNEFKTLNQMLLYAQRYYWMVTRKDNQTDVDEGTMNDIIKLYNKYANELNKKFYEATNGEKVLF